MASAKVLLIVVPGFAFLSFMPSTAWACFCIEHSVKIDSSHSDSVFRGVATSIKAFPLRPESERPRFVVTFAVSQYWKGTPARRIALNVVEPGTDCIGAHFEEGKEYVVFAAREVAEDHLLGRDFWYGWLDVLPRGAKILTVNSACNATDEIGQSAKTLRALGKGRKLLGTPSPASQEAIK